MFTNWKQTPQQMFQDRMMGGSVATGGQQMMRPPMMQPGAAGPMPGMPQDVQPGMPGMMQQPLPQPMPQPMPGDMMGRPQMPSNMIGRPMDMHGQQPVMPPRPQMPGNFAGTNGSGLMGYRPGR